MKRFLGILLAMVILCCAAFATAETADQTKEPIKIGVLMDLSASGSVLGTASLNGIELAAARMNEAGGMDGHQVEIIPYDIKSDSNEAISAYERLVRVDGVSVVLGPPIANIGLSMATVTNQYKVPVVGSWADVRITLGENRDSFNPYLFVMQATSDYYGMLIADYLHNELNVQKCGILVSQDHAFNKSCADAFEAQAKKIGMEITAVEYNKQADTDVKTQLIAINNSGAEAMAIFSPTQPLVVSTTQAYQLGMEMIITGSNDFSLPFADLVKDTFTANNIYFATNVDFDDPALQELRQEYIGKYGAEPTRFSYLGYDQMTIVAEAVRKAGSIDPAAITQALTNEIKDLPLCSGVFSFDPQTNLPLGLSEVIYKIEDGNYNMMGRYIPAL